MNSPGNLRFATPAQENGRPYANAYARNRHQLKGLRGAKDVVVREVKIINKCEEQFESFGGKLIVLEFPRAFRRGAVQSLDPRIDRIYVLTIGQALGDSCVDFLVTCNYNFSADFLVSYDSATSCRASGHILSELVRRNSR